MGAATLVHTTAPQNSSILLGTLALAAAAGMGILLSRRWLASLMVLFSRLATNDLLRHPLRSSLFEHVQQEPGLHQQSLAQRLDQPRVVIAHHLQVLAKAGLLHERQEGRLRRYYPMASGGLEGPGRVAVAQALLRATKASPGLPLTALANSLGVQRKLVSYHAHKLAAAGLLHLERRGRETRACSGPPAV